MAEEAPSTPGAKNSKPSFSSLLGGNKPIPTFSFIGFLFAAIVIDLVLSDWLPFSGTAFVAACRGIYWLNGYKTDKMLLTTLTTEILGAIPVVADFTNIIFVVVTFLINRAETSRAGAAVGGRALRMKVNKGVREYKVGQQKRNERIENQKVADKLGASGAPKHFDGVRQNDVAAYQARHTELASQEGWDTRQKREREERKKQGLL